ncbi:MAG TPA: glycerophosphodiester phosphodiesterase family protein [Candidatus Krumholzibacteria bacterium]|nr:glycerophosphodiester phosphodiesterase family protein [Candidatus Krumholzibacteria bacterium]HPD71922.1 glycerophosphodiester phosphodiesterase family protein [Candidatus Krumholzibacteria bacterium]HRY41145.1 glycerophosphodiester phosphodiesterase family protein [Candidatus Krumholzibacteria bacterium]
MPAVSRLSRGAETPVCIAHRGASGQEPENTLRAFARALEQGATWFELDVHLVHGRLLVIHDATLERTTNGTGPLTAHTLAELRALDAGKGQRIPFLEEVLELAVGRARINVELKGAGTLAPVLAIVRDAVAGGAWRPDQFLLSCFDWDVLDEARQREPAIPVAPLAGKGAGGEVLETADRLGAEAIHVSRWSARARLVEAAHARGLAVRVFPINSQWEYDLMVRLGVDGIFTDFPARVLAWGAAAPAIPVGGGGSGS